MFLFYLPVTGSLLHIRFRHSAENIRMGAFTVITVEKNHCLRSEERRVGKAIRESEVPRKKSWITSKLWPNEYGKGKILAAIDRMLGRFSLDYLDMVYLHQPVGDYAGIWLSLIHI